MGTNTLKHVDGAYGSKKNCLLTIWDGVSDEAMVKLKRSEVTKFKQGLWDKQKGVCPLCLKDLPQELSKCALDHNHVTGECRGLLHLGCNKVEGNLFNSIGRWGGVGKDYSLVIPYLERLLAYIKTAKTGRIYHLHKTEDELREQRNKKARQAYARAKAKTRLTSIKSKGY